MNQKQPNIPESRAEYPLSRIGEYASMVGDEKYNLATLAGAFVRLGQDQVAEELYAVADRLEAYADAIRANVGQEVSDKLRETQQSTSNMLSALVGGMKIGGLDTEALERVFPQTPAE